MKTLADRVEWLIAVVMGLIIVCAFQSAQLQNLKDSYLKNIKTLANNQKIFKENDEKEAKIFELVSKVLIHHDELILKHEKILASEGKIRIKKEKE